jgi:demethylmenaquinone methyltransferase/2-methoxy-6-polyprenyl-1,4-benzoquinol methylase
MYRKDSPQTIQAMFNSIADHYDLANVVLSFSLYKRWNKALIRHVLKPSSPLVFLDLCAGTGEIAFQYLRTLPTSCHAYLIDFSSDMLEQAKRKATSLSFPAPHTLSYLEANVQELPLPDQLADCATMAYGMRNVQQPARCLQDVFRVLKPGGCFGVLELTRPTNRLLRLGHQLYLRTFLPLVGKWLTANQQAYQYLCQSIHTFIAPQELENLFVAQGFVHTQRHSLAGGIATLIIGYKPLS